MSERSLAQIDWNQLLDRDFHPSPPAWEDHVFYFLMLDRFSNGSEMGCRGMNGEVIPGGSTPAFAAGDAQNVDRETWTRAGDRWCGGTLAGLNSKLGYLKRLGITALWISPVFKQVPFRESYHGYGIQHFLDVDPHFGTREELRDLVQAAHAVGIYVILDIILNHTGPVFGYNADRYLTTRGGSTFMEPRWDGKPYTVAGYCDEHGEATLPFAPVTVSEGGAQWSDRAVWPSELQNPHSFSQLGQITNWDYEPEFLTGDFFELKDVRLGEGSVDEFIPSTALQALSEIYQFWMAYADIDGYRIDTVKHMSPGATRFFASTLHEFAQQLGKEQFYLIGEITGGRSRAFQTLEATGLDAALGIDDIPDKLEYLVKGYRDPRDYFSLFRNSLLVGKESHTWFRNKVVTMFDDHDQVRKGSDKARFCAGENGDKLIVNALLLNLCSIGIPCIYYGTEQGFNGAGPGDRFLRECMFGGNFGSFQSRERHFFRETSGAYTEIQKILAARRQLIPLRRGRQYLREISGDGVRFGIPALWGHEIRSIVAWSRILADNEVICAINTDPESERSAWVTIDGGLHAAGEQLQIVCSSDESLIGRRIAVEARNGCAIRLTLPAASYVICD